MKTIEKRLIEKQKDLIEKLTISPVVRDMIHIKKELKLMEEITELEKQVESNNRISTRDLQAIDQANDEKP
jgi:hypothetical protein